jgi:hypothetical protein
MLTMQGILWLGACVSFIVAMLGKPGAGWLGLALIAFAHLVTMAPLQ